MNRQVVNVAVVLGEFSAQLLYI